MVNRMYGWRVQAIPGRKAGAPRGIESVLLPAQKSRDVEMVVFRDWRARNGSNMCLRRPLGPRRLRARLSADRIGRSQSLGPLKRGHWRRGSRGGKCGSGLAIVTRDAERGQLLQERPAARLGRGGAVLR